MDENHGVRVKRSRVADLGQVVREIAPSIKPKPSIKGYIALGIREYMYIETLCYLRSLPTIHFIINSLKNFRAVREVWRTKKFQSI